jgi:CRP-like cAMP-binding protein
MALLSGDGRRNADVVASSPMVVFAMFGTSFREMQAAYPSVVARIEATLQQRLATS